MVSTKKSRPFFISFFFFDIKFINMELYDIMNAINKKLYGGNI